MNKLTGKKSWLIAFGLSLFIFIFSFSAVSAKSFEYESYYVEINVNKDSTMEVYEKLVYRFDGEFSAATRGIQLNDPNVLAACRNSGSRTCGGFEYLVVTEVKGDGVKLDPSQYTSGIEEYEDGSSYYIIDWEFAPDGRFFDGDELFVFEVRYKVYGGVRFVGENPYLYWNALPTEKGGLVENSVVKLSIPQEVVNPDNLSVYGNLSYSYEVDGSSIYIDASRLSASSDLTISYKMNPNAILAPSKVDIVGWPKGQDLYLDGVLIGQSNFTLDYFPSGRHTVKGEFNGYESKEISVNIEPGSDTTIELNLTPNPFTQILIFINYILILVGICLFPLAIILAYYIWRLRGRDKDKKDTIVPIFHPPIGMKPYMLGSLIDEKVDKHDISGAIIDLAYRGYIKIQEIKKGKNYKLTLSDKSREDLTDIEKDIVDALFSNKDEVETKDIGPRFARKYPQIVSKIYRSMVNTGYFKSSPETTRNAYLGISMGLIGAGIAISVFSTLIVLVFIGHIGPFTLGIGMIIFGISLLLASKYMPAKTSFGSKIHAEILGFKMYLETAEKYRLQDLTPEEFEKYLSYAIVMGVEEKWASSFKDIYDTPPEWYESSSMDAFNAYWLTRSINSMTNNMESSVFTPVSSGGASGSGWSGSTSSFGGFSGGGGGGGFSGAR